MEIEPKKLLSLDYKSILVTGGAGFIGSNFINWIVPRYPNTKFVNFDKLDYCACLANIEDSVSKSSNYIFVKGNLLDEYLLLKIMNMEKIDAIIHFAAHSHVDNSFGNSIDFTLNNVLGTHKLLEAARIYGNIKKFVHISTDEVYGEIATGESHEHSILDPTNPYAASKAAAEFIVKSYYYSFRLPIIITRGNNVYGPRQYPEKVVPRFITLLRDMKKCTIHGSGDNIRNFIYVDDTVRAIETILIKGEIAQIYNIGGTEERTVLEIAKLLINRLIPSCPPNKWDNYIQFVADRKFNDKRYSVNSDKLLNLGWKQEVTLGDGFERTVKWYLEHPHHFSSCGNNGDTYHDSNSQI